MQGALQQTQDACLLDKYSAGTLRCMVDPCCKSTRPMCEAVAYRTKAQRIDFHLLQSNMIVV